MKYIQYNPTCLLVKSERGEAVKLVTLPTRIYLCLPRISALPTTFVATRWFQLFSTYRLFAIMTGDTPARKVTLPEFWSSSPDLWFIRAEGEFTLKAISVEATKHAYLVSALKEEHALKVRDSLRAPDSTAPYSKLKEALLAAYQTSDHHKACTLLDMKSLPSERPTEILDKMMALLPAAVSPTDPGWLFQTLFLRHLPADISTHLVSSSFDSIRAMAVHADLLHDARQPAVPIIAAVSEPAPPPPPASALPSPPPPATPAFQHCCGGPVAAVQSVCWYHTKWGEKATRCNPPCSWRPRQAGNGRGRRR